MSLLSCINKKPCPSSTSTVFTCLHHSLMWIRIWSQTLGIPPPEPDDDFFFLGGDSLSALAVVKGLVEWDGMYAHAILCLHARSVVSSARLKPDQLAFLRGWRLCGLCSKCAFCYACVHLTKNSCHLKINVRTYIAYVVNVSVILVGTQVCMHSRSCLFERARRRRVAGRWRSAWSSCASKAV